MNEVMRQWVVALRSGEYRQTTNTLEFIDEGGSSSYCCLGVLCKLAERAKVVERSAVISEVAYGHSYKMPPDEVLEWAGLSFETANEYTKMNDKAGMNFNEIADKIEKEQRDGEETWESIAAPNTDITTT